MRTLRRLLLVATLAIASPLPAILGWRVSGETLAEMAEAEARCRASYEFAAKRRMMREGFGLVGAEFQAAQRRNWLREHDERNAHATLTRQLALHPTMQSRADLAWFGGLAGTLVLCLVAAGFVFLAPRERWGAHRVVAPTPFLTALTAAVPGTREGATFRTEVGGRLVVLGLGPGATGVQWTVQITAPPGAPRNARIHGIAEIVDLARSARAASRKDAALRRLADSLEEFTGDWRTLFRVYSVESIAFEQGVVSARVGFGGGALTPPEEARRVLALVERLVKLTRAIGEILDLKARATSSARCPYCHDDLSAADPAATTSCERCRSRHHAECFAEHGSCAVFGCAPRDGERVRVQVG